MNTNSAGAICSLNINWTSFLEEASPSESLRAALNDKEGREEETGEGLLSPF